VIGSDSVTAVSEFDVDAGDCHTSSSPPDSLPVIRQSGASSAIDDVIAYVDGAGIATTPVAHGDVVDMSEDSVQASGICYVMSCHVHKPGCTAESVLHG